MTATTTWTWGALALLTASSLAAGCGCGDVACEPCGDDGILVAVTDATTGDAIEDATVSTTDQRCSLSEISSPGTYTCDVPPGTYEVTVAAPGREGTTLEVTLPAEDDPGCCSCGPTVVVEAALSPP